MTPGWRSGEHGASCRRFPSNPPPHGGCSTRAAPHGLLRLVVCAGSVTVATSQWPRHSGSAHTRGSSPCVVQASELQCREEAPALIPRLPTVCRRGALGVRVKPDWPDVVLAGSAVGPYRCAPRTLHAPPDALPVRGLANFSSASHQLAGDWALGNWACLPRPHAALRRGSRASCRWCRSPRPAGPTAGEGVRVWPVVRTQPCKRRGCGLALGCTDGSPAAPCSRPAAPAAPCRRWRPARCPASPPPPPALQHTPV